MADQAEATFKSLYPSIHAFLKPKEPVLRKRQDKGKHWWELRACAYWDAFESPKIIYQEIQFHPPYALDTDSRFGNNKTFFLPTGDLFLTSQDSASPKVGGASALLPWWRKSTAQVTTVCVSPRYFARFQ